MRAYDALPVDVRHVIANARYNYSCVRLLPQWLDARERGMTPTRFASAVREYDDRMARQMKGER